MNAIKFYFLSICYALATLCKRGELYSFWFSEQHAAHYRSINSFGGFASGWDRDGRVWKNYVSGVPYTSCRSDLFAREPYDGALKTFPDYRRIGVGTMSDINMEGRW